MLEPLHQTQTRAQDPRERRCRQATHPHFHACAGLPEGTLALRSERCCDDRLNSPSSYGENRAVSGTSAHKTKGRGQEEHDVRDAPCLPLKEITAAGVMASPRRGSEHRWCRETMGYWLRS